MPKEEGHGRIRSSSNSTSSFRQPGLLGVELSFHGFHTSHPRACRPPQLPCATSGKQVGQLFKPLLVHLVEAIQLRAVNVDDGNDLLLTVLLGDNGHHNLALAVAVTGDMARERLDICNELRLSRCGGRTAHTPAEEDGLAGDFALKGPQDELSLARARVRVKDVEAGPVDGVSWCRE